MPHGLSSLILSQCEGKWRGLRGRWVEWSVLLTPRSCLLSETRLVEVLEDVCSKSDFECHRLLELSEELVEAWWFHK